MTATLQFARTAPGRYVMRVLGETPDGETTNTDYALYRTSQDIPGRVIMKGMIWTAKDGRKYGTGTMLTEDGTGRGVAWPQHGTQCVLGDRLRPCPNDVVRFKECTPMNWWPVCEFHSH